MSYFPNLFVFELVNNHCAEPGALERMARFLTEQSPRLAVSAHHRPDHVWTPLRRLSEFDLDYRFHLRSDCTQSFDGVLYAGSE